MRAFQVVSHISIVGLQACKLLQLWSRRTNVVIEEDAEELVLPPMTVRVICN